jgi:hypothetical protein
MDEYSDGDDDGHGEVGAGANDDPFSDLERVTDDEEDEGEGEDLFENQEMWVWAKVFFCAILLHPNPSPSSPEPNATSNQPPTTQRTAQRPSTPLPHTLTHSTAPLWQTKSCASTNVHLFLAIFLAPFPHPHCEEFSSPLLTHPPQRNVDTHVLSTRKALTLLPHDASPHPAGTTAPCRTWISTRLTA